jgi:Flp pilus assembly protein TadD
MGLGNTAYAAGDLVQAARAFERAAEIDATSGDAWNNLANALFALGRDAEAAQAARRAVALGGPRAARYRATLTTIEQALR